MSSPAGGGEASEPLSLLALYAEWISKSFGHDQQFCRGGGRGGAILLSFPPSFLLLIAVSGDWVLPSPAQQTRLLDKNFLPGTRSGATGVPHTFAKLCYTALSWDNFGAIFDIVMFLKNCWNSGCPLAIREGDNKIGTNWDLYSFFPIKGSPVLVAVVVGVSRMVSRLHCHQLSSRRHGASRDNCGVRRRRPWICTTKDCCHHQ